MLPISKFDLHIEKKKIACLCLIQILPLRCSKLLCVDVMILFWNFHGYLHRSLSMRSRVTRVLASLDTTIEVPVAHLTCWITCQVVNCASVVEGNINLSSSCSCLVFSFFLLLLKYSTTGLVNDDTRRKLMAFMRFLFVSDDFQALSGSIFHPW